MPPTKIWKIDPHTSIKHEILRRYLEAWYPKLKWARRVLFIDGFAGPGIYLGGEPGSPRVALDAAINHSADLSSLELVYYFIEERPNFHASLVEVIQGLEDTGTVPSNMNITAEKGTFEECMTRMLDAIGKAKLAPCMTMVDPFGVKGLPIELLARIAQHPRTELLVSFMYESMSRFISTPELEPHLDHMFGTPDWRSANGMKAADKKKFLVDLYVQQIRASGMKFVRTFELRDDGNRTEYMLVFATNSFDGLSAMKDSMWAADPSGSFMFSDFTAATPTLFHANPDFAPLRQALIDRFRGKRVLIDKILEFAVIETPFRSAHVKTLTLKPMYDEGLISTSHPTRGQLRAGTFPDGTIVKFLD